MPASDDDVQTVKFKTGAKAKVRAKLEAFGETWDLIRPNQVTASRLVDHGGDINAGYIADYIGAHVVKDQRDAFLLAAAECETLDVEALLELMETMTEAVYEGTPS